MRPLTPHEVVRVCEWGQGKHALDRALMLLRVASPGLPQEALAELPLGQRDRLLLDLRAETFGEALEMRVPCPTCREPLELELTAQELRLAPPERQRREASHGEWELSYRLPNSRDLAAVVALPLPAARSRLLERCVREVRRGGQPASFGELPAELLERLLTQLSEDDPQADISFELTCPACHHGWQAVFDVLSFFWTELEALTRQLQEEVHVLARGYGWTENAILSLSAASRRHYLELLGSE